MFERYERPVRCSQGHLYTSIWIPFVSLKAARLGPNRRFQRCPVGHHWSMTERLDPDSLMSTQQAEAAAAHDARVP